MSVNPCVDPDDPDDPELAPAKAGPEVAAIF